jgi:hypothetical protein
MTRTGHSKDQQHQIRQLIFECSLAKMSSFQTQQILKEKLDISVTISWINKIKAGFKEDARKEYYHLLTDNFAYKYLTMQVIQQLHEIIRQQWDIADSHKSKNDLIALKALSEVKNSVLCVSEFCKFLPEVENNLFSLKVNHKNSNDSDWMFAFVDNGNGKNNNGRFEDFSKIDIDKEPSLTEEERELIRRSKMYVAGRDTDGMLILEDEDYNDEDQSKDEGFDVNARF